MFATKGTIPISEVQYDRTQPIGKGAFGVVYRGTIPEHKGPKTHRPEMDVAVKEFKVATSSMLVRELQTSLMTCSKLKHPCILQYVSWRCLTPPYVIVSEYMPLQLSNLIHESRDNNCAYVGTWEGKTVKWDTTSCAIIVYGIACGMRVLHKHKIVHRDLKPDNVLLSGDLIPKICDFGFARQVGNDMTSQIGTPLYEAPELMAGRLDAEGAKRADVYAYGMTVYEILSQVRPFDDIPDFYSNNSVMTSFLHDVVANGEHRPSLGEETGIPQNYPNMPDLIQDCWNQNPADRPTFDEIVERLSTSEFWENVPGFDDEAFQTFRDKVAEAEAETERASS